MANLLERKKKHYNSCVRANLSGTICHNLSPNESLKFKIPNNLNGQ